MLLSKLSEVSMLQQMDVQVTRGMAKAEAAHKLSSKTTALLYRRQN